MNEDLIMASLARLETGQGSMRSDFEGLSGRFDSVRGKVDSLSGRFDSLSGKVDSLGEKFDSLGEKFDSLSVRTDRLESGQTSIRQEITTLRVEVMARMDRLQNILTGVQDDISVNMGAADAVHRANENTRADLRGLQEQVSVMWRQLKTVEARVRQLSGDA